MTFPLRPLLWPGPGGKIGTKESSKILKIECVDASTIKFDGHECKIKAEPIKAEPFNWFLWGGLAVVVILIIIGGVIYYMLKGGGDGGGGSSSDDSETVIY